MADPPNPSSGDLPADAGGSLAPTNRRVAALAGAGARYKAMSPARLPISRDPCLTIPARFSPSALLESPVLLTNLRVEPSPTTGTLSMAAIINKSTHPDILPSPRDKSVGNGHEDGGSRDFEFNPHLNSSTHSVDSTHSLNGSSGPNQPVAMVGPSDNMPSEVGTSELHQMNSSENAVQETQSENVVEKSAEEWEPAISAEQRREKGQVAGNLLCQFEQILHDDPLIDEVGFLHPTQFCSLDLTQNGNSTIQDPDIYQRYFWCRDHKLAISSEILPKLYCTVRDAYTNARTARDTSTTDLMSHNKALLILCPDSQTSWNSRKIILSLNYDYTMLENELKLCALIFSYSPKNESTWSHRRWVIKKVLEQNQNISEIIEKESRLVEKIAEKSKMNYRAWRHRCWLIHYMTRKQVLNELKKSTRWSELHVADNCCFHYRRSLLCALRESSLENGDDSLGSDSETCLLWKEELRWDEMLIRRYRGRESLWIHRRFLSQWWIQQSLSCDETSSIPSVDTFVAHEVNLLWACMHAPSDEFEESRVQAEVAALYILWISKQVPAVKEKLEERIYSMSMGRLEDVLGGACRPEKKRLWMSMLGLAVNS